MTNRSIKREPAMRAQTRNARIALLLSAVATLLLATPAGAQLPVARLATVFPAGGKIGSTVEVGVTGAELDQATQIHFSHPGITAKPKLVEKTGQPEANKFIVSIGKNVPVGIYEARVIGRFGVSNPRGFAVGDLAEVVGKSPNNTFSNATEITVGAIANGRADANAADFYKFTAKQGQRILIDCQTREIDSRLNESLVLFDSTGRELERARRG